MQRNYIRTSIRSQINAEFFYFDLPDYQADEIFARYDLHPKFYDEFEHEGSPYRIIRCRVRMCQVHTFAKVMEELGRKMLLTGHPDYLDTAEAFFSDIDAYMSGDMPAIEATEDELTRADVENLRLYLKHIFAQHPDIEEEMDDTFDGLPGYTESVAQ